MKKVLITVLMSAGLMVPAFAQSNGMYQVTPKCEQKFKPAPGGLYSTSNLVQHKNSIALVTMRDKSGEAEVHTGWEDHIFVQDGEAQLTLGGTVDRPRNTAKDEIRGASITGGKTVTVHAGDYIFVPVNTPHRMVLEPGKSIRYAVVKTHP